MGTLFEAIARAARRSAPAGTSTVWAALRVDAAGPQLERERAPLALALVIDVSGSMAGDPLAHVLRSCELVADLLDARDRLAIITFGGHAGVRCGLTVMDDAGRTSVRAALRDVTANGSTNLHAGLEAGAGVLMAMAGGGGGGPAPRRAMVVMSDGVPNIGLSSPTQLAGLVGTLGVATSALGFGLHHDDAVLDAIATAGSGRYAYVPDPLLARVDLARAALAHAGVVADHLEVAVELAAGVELARVVPATPLRVAAGGVKLALGDVFVDEGRLVAFELALDLRAGATGKLATVSVTGTAPDGTRHTETAALAIDIHAGPHVTDRDAERDVELVRAEAARAEARAHVDRGAAPAAVTLLREAIARIEACDGFVAGDGSLLSELREQLIDEIANYERRATAAEASHQRKGGRAYKAHIASQRARVTSPVAARLVGISDPICGLTFELFADTTVGRSSDNDVTIPHDSLSRRHSRFVYVDGAFRVQDFGSTNGTRVNGHHVESCALADRDEVAIGNVVVRFELGPT